MQILIPMAGEGSRFKAEGYSFPKPLIEVRGEPMIKRVVENLKFDAKYIFLVRKEHLESYLGLKSLLSQISRNCYEIVEVPALTQGAACTALLAEDVLDPDDSLLIANSDQIMEYSQDNFTNLIRHTSVDGMIFTFTASHPKWSFVRLNEFGTITEVAEKNPISNVATCGVYWFRKASDFIHGAKSMITKNIRTNNEFYIAPVFNETILEKKTILPFFVEKMHGIGTPEDLKLYLNAT